MISREEYSQRFNNLVEECILGSSKGTKSELQYRRTIMLKVLKQCINTKYYYNIEDAIDYYFAERIYDDNYVNREFHDDEEIIDVIADYVNPTNISYIYNSYAPIMTNFVLWKIIFTKYPLLLFDEQFEEISSDLDPSWGDLLIHVMDHHPNLFDEYTMSNHTKQKRISIYNILFWLIRLNTLSNQPKLSKIILDIINTPIINYKQIPEYNNELYSDLDELYAPLDE